MILIDIFFNRVSTTGAGETGAIWLKIFFLHLNDHRSHHRHHDHCDHHDHYDHRYHHDLCYHRPHHDHYDHHSHHDYDDQL